MKKLLVFVLVCVLVLLSEGAVAENLDAKTSGDWEYIVLEDGTAAITKAIANGIVEFPSMIDGYTVTQIGRRSVDYGIDLNQSEATRELDVFSTMYEYSGVGQACDKRGRR